MIDWIFASNSEVDIGRSVRFLAVPEKILGKKTPIVISHKTQQLRKQQQQVPEQ